MKIPGILILAIALAEVANVRAEVFAVEAINEPVLRLQTRKAEGKEAEDVFVNNYPQERILALFEKEPQAVLTGYSGSPYIVRQFTAQPITGPLEVSMEFSALQATGRGRLIFGLTRGDGSRARREMPKVGVGFEPGKGVMLSYGGFAQGGWQAVEGSEMQPGVTYRVVLKMIPLSGDKPAAWDVELQDEEGHIIAAQRGLPLPPEAEGGFDAILLQSYSKEPFLIESLTAKEPTSELMKVTFQAPDYSVSPTTIVGQGDWGGNAGEAFRVVETKSGLAAFAPARPEGRIYLSKDQYAAEDVHLDVVCILPVRNRDASTYVLDLEIQSADGKAVAGKKGVAVPGSQVAINWSWPDEVVGKEAILQATIRNEKTGAVEVLRAPFAVKDRQTTAKQGSIPIHVPGSKSLAGSIVPQAVGVPFPKGALLDVAALRLVDETGKDVPASFQIDGRWSRFGSARWVRCSFALPVPEQARDLKIIYGEARGDIVVPSTTTEWNGEFSGSYFKTQSGALAGRGPLLKSGALSGAYVVDGKGETFAIDPSEKFEVESEDSQQLILRQQGWYGSKEGSRFCQYDNRITLFKNAPLLRIEHSWTFTGDGNRDTIAEMGWRFPAATDLRNGEFWMGADGWKVGDRLLQYGFDRIAISKGGVESELALRAPGVGRVRLGDGKQSLALGVKDFWQNYPAALAWDQKGFTVLTWPGNGRANGVPVTRENSYQLQFIHSGKDLNFRLPDEFLVPPIYDGAEQHYTEGQVESANAQGIAKTTEMWIQIGEGAESGELALALGDRSLCAYVDADWLAASKVFHEIHAKDTANFPREEALYESVALSPARWGEHMSVYGKWIWGDVLSMPDLENRVVVTNFRTFRKAHQGWPYSWLPYARSGDVRFRQFAEASTRHMADVNFCHYSDERVPRPLGFWNRSLIPWTFVYGPTSRHYCDKVDYLWHAWHLAADYRARETTKLWAKATKTSSMDILPWSGNRRVINMLKTYVDEYQETFDPWFIPAYREVAALARQQATRTTNSRSPLGEASFWNTGPREYLRFTGDPSFKSIYLTYAKYWAAENCDNVWVQFGVMPLESMAYAYQLTKDPYYTKRIRGNLDWADMALYDGPEEWMKGYYSIGKDRLQQAPMFAGYFLSQFPFAEQALYLASNSKDSLPNNIFVRPNDDGPRIVGERELEYPVIHIQKSGVQPVPLQLSLLNVPAKESHPWTCQVLSSEGATMLQETWEPAESKDRLDLAIPQGAPNGNYRVLFGHVTAISKKLRWGIGPALMMPISGAGTPEVFSWQRGRDLPLISQQSQLWFRWPAGEDSLTLQFHFPGGKNEVQRPSVRNEHGEIVWIEQFATGKDTQDRSVECRLDRAKFAPSGMVQVAFPGRDVRWKILGTGEVYFAVSRERWFSPTETRSLSAKTTQP